MGSQGGLRPGEEEEGEWYFFIFFHFDCDGGGGGGGEGIHKYSMGCVDKNVR